MSKHELKHPSSKELAILALEGGAAVVAVRGLKRLSRRLASDTRLVHKGIEGDDLLHTAYIKLLEKAEQFRGESAFSTYAYRVMTNVFKDEVARIRTEQKHGVHSDPELHLETLPDETANSPKAAILAEEHQRLMEGLRQLSEEQQTVLLLFYFEGMTYEQIAVQLKMPVGTVRSHASRGLAKLRGLEVIQEIPHGAV